MNKKIFLGLGIVGLTVSLTANASPVTLYNIDFESPPYPYSIIFGTPSISTSCGQLTTKCLVFSPDIDTYELIQLGMGFGFSSYTVSFDLETRNLRGSDYDFTVSFDTPRVQNFYLNSDGSFSIFNAGTSTSTYGTFGAYVDNMPYHISITTNLVANLWSIGVNNNTLYSGVFYSDGDVSTLRFNLSPWRSDPDNSAVYVSLDNLKVQGVPIPSALWLFASGLVGLLGIRQIPHIQFQTGSG